LTWTAAIDGGSPITGHIIRVYRSKTLVSQVVVDADTSHTISNLKAGSSTYFTVAAMNGVGVGPFSTNSNTVIPVKNTGRYVNSQSANTADLVPNAPSKVSVSHTKSSMTILWTPPTNAVASSYEVWFYQKKKPVAKVVTVASGGIRVFGLKNGTYAIRVRATNVVGTGKLSRIVRFTVD
jgi:predicted phage tail protein